MTDDHPSATALIAAFGRAHHARHAHPPIFADPLAHAWFTDEEHADLSDKLSRALAFFDPAAAAAAPDPAAALATLLRQQTLPISLPRAHYTEEILSTHPEITQYVLVGAGLDTAAFRHSHLAVFELDHPGTQRWKRARLSRLAVTPPPNLHFAELDLSAPPVAIHLRNALAATPFDPRAPTLYAVLGVTYYLPAPALHALFSTLAITPRSHLVFDYQDPDAFDAARCDPRTARMHAATLRANEPMLTPLDPSTLATDLHRAGWHLAEQLGPPQLAARYFADRTDGFSPIPHFWVARATR